MRRMLSLFHFVDPLGTGGVFRHFTCLKTAPREPAALRCLLLATLQVLLDPKDAPP